MTSERLFSFAEGMNIFTLFEPLKHKRAFSFIQENLSVIILDLRKVDRERDLKRVYSEEVGHCITNGFYPFGCCTEALRCNNIAKAEHKAQEASYILQVPFEELQEAIKKGSSDNEIAELLDVDIDTLKNAVECYQRKGLL